MNPGPLQGTRVIEFAGIGPCPFAGLVLADLGAEVIVVERPGDTRLGGGRMMNRGKRSVLLDLKSAAGREAARRLALGADALIEGFRPGVMERLGLGPQPLLEAKPSLVYARVTGWGQDGPLAQAAGHDINYVALTGLATTAARAGQPPALPATLLGDMAGGAMSAVVGVLAALLEARGSGRGQVIDAAMVDGVGYLGSLVHALRAQRLWSDDPRRNFFLHQSPFYDSFACADGRHLSLGAIEPPFYEELLRRLGLDDEPVERQMDSANWPALRARVAARLREKTRDEWCALLEGSEACVAPVLDLEEAANHPHQRARGNFMETDQGRYPRPAPRFSAHPPGNAAPAPQAGQDTRALIESLGLPEDQQAEILGSAGLLR